MSDNQTPEGHIEFPGTPEERMVKYQSTLARYVAEVSVLTEVEQWVLENKPATVASLIQARKTSMLQNIEILTAMVDEVLLEIQKDS